MSDQLLLLKSRGLLGPDEFILEKLCSVNYYRLSGYWYSFRQNDPQNLNRKLDQFFPNTSIHDVWDRYIFDRRLRLLVLDAIERIEVDIRSSLITAGYGIVSLV